MCADCAHRVTVLTGVRTQSFASSSPLNRTDEREPPVGSACAGMRVLAISVPCRRDVVSAGLFFPPCHDLTGGVESTRPWLPSRVHVSRLLWSSTRRDQWKEGELGGYGWCRWAFEVCVSTALTRSPCSRGVYTFASSLAVFLRPPSSAHLPIAHLPLPTSLKSHTSVHPSLVHPTVVAIASTFGHSLPSPCLDGTFREQETFASIMRPRSKPRPTRPSEDGRVGEEAGRNWCVFEVRADCTHLFAAC